MSPAPTLLDRYLRHRRGIVPIAWIGLFVLSIMANTAIVRIDVARTGLQVPSWAPATWEWTSGVVTIALLPIVAWLDSRLPLNWGQLRRSAGLHVLASVLYCIAHVGLMVALRKLIYIAHGLTYDFGDPLAGLAYEYMKDARTYLFAVAIIHLYRLVLLRARGEARLLESPDDAPALEPVERPARFLVRKLGREFLVAATDIERAQASGNYVNLHVRGRDYPLRTTMSALETRLDPARFVRVHRSSIVNVERLRQIEPLEGGDARLHMDDGTPLACSRRYLTQLRERATACTPG
jgi:DNA-binding LytR/AlgR family response regulator